MYATNTVTFNNGDSVTISSYIPNRLVSTLPVTNCYCEGTPEVSTVFNGTPFYNEAMKKDIITQSLMNDFINWRTDSELDSEAYTALKQYIIDNTVWLYGELEQGGCFFYRDQNGEIRAGACYGFVYKSDDINRKKYAISTANTSFSAQECTDMALFFDGLLLADGYSPQLGIAYMNDACYEGTDAMEYYTYDIVPEPGWNHTAAFFLEQCIDECAWKPPLGIGTDKPVKSWRTLNGSEWLKSLNLTLSNSTVLYGNIYGSSEVKPEYNPSADGYNTSNDGGDGDWPTNSDDVQPEDLDDIDTDAINSGFVTLYNPTKPQIEAYNNFLWTGITDSVANQIKKLIANPLDGVLFIAQCHFHPNLTGAGDVIRFCGISSGVGANLIGKQHQEIDCGTLHLGLDDDSFIDYAPYSKASIYLPYCGIKPIDINDLRQSDITVKYHIDLLSGAGIAKIIIKRSARAKSDIDLNSILYEYPCSVYQQFPLSATDWRSAVNNAISLISGAAAVATGNAAGLGAMASAVAGQQVSVVESGNICAQYGYFGEQKPYLILERPMRALPLNYGQYQGLVSNIYVPNLSYTHGYIEVQRDTVWTDNINCTDAEMEEIKELLYSGVWLP